GAAARAVCGAACCPGRRRPRWCRAAPTWAARRARDWARAGSGRRTSAPFRFERRTGRGSSGYSSAGRAPFTPALLVPTRSVGTRKAPRLLHLRRRLHERLDLDVDAERLVTAVARGGQLLQSRSAGGVVALGDALGQFGRLAAQVGGALEP